MSPCVVYIARTNIKTGMVILQTNIVIYTTDIVILQIHIVTV